MRYNEIVWKVSDTIVGALYCLVEEKDCYGNLIFCRYVLIGKDGNFEVITGEYEPQYQYDTEEMSDKDAEEWLTILEV